MLFQNYFQLIVLRLRRNGCDANQEKSDIPQGMTLTPPLLDLWTKSGSQLDSLLDREFPGQDYRNLVYELNIQLNKYETVGSLVPGGNHGRARGRRL